MSTKRYYVRVEVRELDIETDESISLHHEMNWASCAVLDEKAKALAFAKSLHQIATGGMVSPDDNEWSDLTNRALARN